MPYKIVGADENSNFPPRVEAKLATKFASPAYADQAATTAGNTAMNAAKAYTDSAIADIPSNGLTEDPDDPGFFI